MPFIRKARISPEDTDLYLTGQNVVTWPLQAARESGKDSSLEGRGVRCEVGQQQVCPRFLSSPAVSFSLAGPWSHLGPWKSGLPWSAPFGGWGMWPQGCNPSKGQPQGEAALRLTVPTLRSVQAPAWPPACAGRSLASSPVRSPSRRTWPCSWKPWTSFLTC